MNVPDMPECLQKPFVFLVLVRQVTANKGGECRFHLVVGELVDVLSHQIADTTVQHLSLLMQHEIVGEAIILFE